MCALVKIVLDVMRTVLAVTGGGVFFSWKGGDGGGGGGGSRGSEAGRASIYGVRPPHGDLET